jgi:hypothetical protein
VLGYADGLKGTLSGENLLLQEVASALLLKLDELLELYSVSRNLGEALAMLKICPMLLHFPLLFLVLVVLCIHVLCIHLLRAWSTICHMVVS